MIKQGIKGIIRFMGWMLKGTAWILVHILKLALCSAGDCPAYGWECIEDDVIVFSCRAMLGEWL